MKFEIILSNQFRKDLKSASKRGYKLELLDQVVTALANGESLPPVKHDHALAGIYSGFRECHIQPDWLLIYRIDGKNLILFLSRTGSHSDLF